MLDLWLSVLGIEAEVLSRLAKSGLRLLPYLHVDDLRSSGGGDLGLLLAVSSAASEVHLHEDVGGVLAISEHEEVLAQLKILAYTAHADKLSDHPEENGGFRVVLLAEEDAEEDDRSDGHEEEASLHVFEVGLQLVV